jgi:hypothetical protein
LTFPFRFITIDQKSGVGVSKKPIFKHYFQRLAEVAASGDAREESFYSSLESLLEQIAEVTGRKNIHVTTLPKKTEAGNPDFRLWNGKDRIVGYIEAKKPTEENLNQIEDSNQLRRYRSTFPNLILTNFLEFRLYRNGERMDSVLAARPLILNRIGATPPVEKPEELWGLIERFLDFSVPRASTAEELAIELAKRTRFLRDIVAQQLEAEKDGGPAMLTGFYEAFQKFLIGDLTPEDFADLYAQTITYGLFAARTRDGNAFNRRTAFDKIPRTIGILRDLFRFISLGELPTQLEWVVDDIAEVLAVADTPGILDRYYRDGKGRDPIVHFYETFLAQYDPEERERRGVYYTPEPVVSYIVRSLHHLLKTEFSKADGLASDGVTLLDPAAGTMTFVARAAREAVGEFEKKYGSGAQEDFIRRHILQNFYAFELMMAPYAVGHLKMSFFLEELGHRLDDDERVRFYLTNTLDMQELEESRLPGYSSLADESHLAGEVKKQRPILVILGNPPYSGHSSNRGPWIRGLIEDYKQVDGKALGEKNPKWLQDDYVKFLRFAQWKIEQAGRGVVGMITNHSYLDNPTFRGMRQSLMHSFDDIYVLDLHGNALKREVCPDGSPDQNVFDIRQGVAIAFFIKRGKKKKGGEAPKVRHAEIWGVRDHKYRWLEKYEVVTTDWRDLHPKSSLYLFIPRDEALGVRYEAFPSVSQIFPVNSVGIVTARDGLTIHWSPGEAWRTVTVFSRMDPELARQGYELGKDAKDWKVTWAQKDLLDSGPSREKIVPILYRPFDIRHTYFTGKSSGFHCRPRPEVMRHMLRENLALITPKQNKNEFGALVSETIGAHKSVAAYDINYYFPLYIYPEFGRQDLFSKHEPSDRQPNLNPKIVEALKGGHSRQPMPEQIFHYIYAVLYVPTFRGKYAEFLRSDFPRIPFPADRKLFMEMASLGQRLTELHLLRSPELDQPTARFEGAGDGRVAKSKSEGLFYEVGKQCLHINKTQHFAPVPEEVWGYQVGGYQVSEKWLKDHKGRKLDHKEIQTYCRIVTALKITIEIQEELDVLYPQIEGQLLEIALNP